MPAFDNATLGRIRRMSDGELFLVMQLLNCCSSSKDLLIGVTEEWLSRKTESENTGRHVAANKITRGQLSDVMVVVDDEKMSAAEAASLYGLQAKHVVHRVNNHGWTIQKAATTPLCRQPH